MRAPAILAVLATVALTGCATAGSTSSTSKGFTGQEKQVADKIGALQTAGTGKKATDVCDDIVTSGLRQQLSAGNSTCAQEVKKAMDDADAFDLSVKDVTITGDKATAKVATKDRGKDVTRTFQLAKQGGGWRIAGFG